MINHLVLLCCLKNIKLLAIPNSSFEVSKILKIPRFSALCLLEECLKNNNNKFLESVRLLLKVGKIPSCKWIHDLKNKKINNLN